MRPVKLKSLRRQAAVSGPCIFIWKYETGEIIRGKNKEKHLVVIAHHDIVHKNEVEVTMTQFPLLPRDLQRSQAVVRFLYIRVRKSLPASFALQNASNDLAVHRRVVLNIDKNVQINTLFLNN